MNLASPAPRSTAFFSFSSFNDVTRLATLALVSASASRADTLFENNFDQLVTDRIGYGQYPNISPWEGPSAKEYGWVGVSGALSALTLFDKSASPNQSATLQFSWKGRAPETGKLTATWDFSIPVAGEYLGVQFIGGKGWDDSALVLILKDEAIVVHGDEGAASQMTLGFYTPKRWHSINVTLDVAAKTAEILLDGKQVLRGYPWVRKTATKLDRITIAADTAPVDRQGGPVLFIDNVSIISSP